MLEQLLGMFPKYDRNEFAPGPSYHDYFDRSFAVSGDHLTNLVEVMKHGVVVSCPDKAVQLDVRAYTRTGEKRLENLDEVLSYGNRSPDRLRALGLRVRSDDGSTAAMVRFQDYGPGWSAAVIVEGGDEQASRGLFEKLRESVKETFQWYSFLLSSRFWTGLLLLFVIAYLAYFVSPPVRNWLLPESTRSSETLQSASTFSPGTVTESLAPDAVETRSSSIPIIVICVVCAVSLLLGFEILPMLFPKGIFLIGEEIRRYWWITGGRIVLLVVLILVPVVSMWLKHRS